MAKFTTRPSPNTSVRATATAASIEPYSHASTRLTTSRLVVAELTEPPRSYVPAALAGRDVASVRSRRADHRAGRHHEQHLVGVADPVLRMGQLLELRRERRHVELPSARLHAQRLVPVRRLEALRGQ